MGNQEQLKAIVSKLLSLRKIKKVVYVDEEFGSQLYKDRYVAYIRKFFNKSWFRLPFDFYKDAGADAILVDFDDWWEKSSEEERMESIQALHINKGNAYKMKNKLESILGNSIEQEYVHPITFQLNFDNSHYNATSNKQLLVLMDYDLKGVDYDGLYYLRCFRNKKNVQCGLFSGTFGKDDEIERWNSLCHQSSYIYPLSKSRIADDDGFTFVEGLRNVLWFRQITEIKKDYTRIFKQATKELSLFMDSFDPSTFNSIVLAKSENEGCWEFDTLHRICCIKLNDEFEKKVVKGHYFQSFQRKVGVLRNLRTKAIDALTTDTQITKELVELEHFEDNNFINSTYSQIHNGDIFKINNEHYILLCQPCNLEIRDKGKRKAGELLHIVPMASQEKSIDTARMALNDFQNKKKKFLSERKYEDLANHSSDIDFDKLIPDDSDIISQSTSYIKYNGGNYLLRYNKAKLVDARTLDLVSFNKTSKATLVIDKRTFKRYVQPNMQIRYKNITEHIKQQSPNLEDYKPYGFNGTRIADLDITRIGRLKDPWAQEYLQEFMAYLSRPAYPMDLE